jgi:hypothetical protein
MTLASLMEQPHPSYKKIQYSPLTEDNCPDLSLEWNGRNLTQRETFCLLTHVVVTDQTAILPEAWRDPLALGILEIADRSTHPWATAFFGGAAPKMAGPRALNELADRVRTGRALPQTLAHLLEPLLARDWRSAVPFFTEALLATRNLNGYFKSHVEERLETVRVQLGVSSEIWELLSIPESHLAPERIAKTRQVWAAKLEEFMRREVRMNAKEFRLLTEHPAHGENLRGLVVMVHSKDSTRLDAWPFQLGDGDLASIVHPLLLEPREREEWKARMASEDRVAPFDQWKDAGKTPRLDLDGLTANPSELMLHLEARGWRRGRAGVDGMIRSHSKQFPDIQLLAVVQYTGIPNRYGGRWSRQIITGCAFENESTGSSVETARVSPIVVSVVMEDLAGLKA